MPFTPYHFGIGLVVKAIAPASFSMTAFVAVQVVVDVETLYYLIHGQAPWHRVLHSFAGATATGLLVGWALTGLLAGAKRFLPHETRDNPRPLARGEVTRRGVLLGALVGGISHTVLDGIVHGDVRPFAPLSSANPFYGLATWRSVELACVLCALAGAVLLARNTVPSDDAS